MKVHGAVQGSLMSTLGMGEGENRTLANGQWGCCLLKAVVYVPSMTSKQSKTLNHLQYVSLRKEGDLFFFFWQIHWILHIEHHHSYPSSHL